jgi:Flp pilus assembly protein TadG
MRSVRDLLDDPSGAGAAEFALVLPLFLLFLLGIIDAGRYAWAFNQAEKATQIGARWAVVTDPIPSEMASYNFVSSTVPQGSVVPQTAFAGVQCKTSGLSTTADCTCQDGGACGFDASQSNDAAWTGIVGRMQDIYANVGPGNVVIDYDWSGLGYAGDPNGPDISPLITVTLRGLEFQPAFLGILGVELPIPPASYTLTMEDANGSESN